MTVFLVRHAVAVGRSQWDGHDALRPLTKRGERQAQALVDLLADGGADVRRILSSPAVRCRDTVAPLAAKLGLDLGVVDTLAEGARAKDALALVQELGAGAPSAGPGDAVLCAHGDLVPELVRRLAREGMAWDGNLRFAKGSTWVLDFAGDRCVEGRYVEPGA